VPIERAGASGDETRELRSGIERMSQTAKAQEPSMEEILASIRRIIADDDGGKSPKAPEPPAPPPAAVASRPDPAPEPPPASNSQDDIDAMFAEPELPAAKPVPPQPPPAPPAPGVLDLTEDMAAPPEAPSPAPSFRTIDAASDVVFTDRPPAPPQQQPEFEPAPMSNTADPSLISNTTAAVVDNAFNTLAYTVLGQNARTLEDLVKEMLRPMLKSWLDDNLPGLVERIVRAEIERVSRGRS